MYLKYVKFIYSEKATKLHTVKSKGKISQNFVAFSEYMNFTTYRLHRVDFSKVLGCHSPLNAAERKFMVVFQESVNGLEWCGNDNQN